jgi:hypothetical protein
MAANGYRFRYAFFVLLLYVTAKFAAKVTLLWCSCCMGVVADAPWAPQPSESESCMHYI